MWYQLGLLLTAAALITAGGRGSGGSGGGELHLLFHLRHEHLDFSVNTNTRTLRKNLNFRKIMNFYWPRTHEEPVKMNNQREFM